MKVLKAIVAGTISGLIFGVSLIFLFYVTAGAIAWSSGIPADIPFFVSFWPAPGGGPNGVEFVVNSGGMLAVVTVSMIASVVLALLEVGRKARVLNG